MLSLSFTMKAHRFRRTFLCTAAVAWLLGFAVPIAFAAPPDGAQLYAQHCAACHGNRGSGGVGVPLQLPDFLATVDDQYLRKTIRLGRPGRVMPAFMQPSDAEVDALVRHIRSWQNVPPKALPAVRRGDAARGAQLYAQHCAACHGANGEGGHGTGVTFSRPRELPILAPALNNPGFLAAASDGLIKAALMYGREGTPMRSFLDQGLSERDIDDIVAHVRAFEQHPRAYRPRPLKDEPPFIMRESPYGVEETVEKLKTAFNAANMRVVRVEYFAERFVGPEAVNKKRKFVDGCDFAFVNQALAIDPRVGIFLPCRVTVVEEQGKVQVMAMNPKFLSALFNNHELDELCEKMSQVYLSVIEEATL